MKMNVIIETLLIGGVCMASVACGSKQKSDAAEEQKVAAKPKVTFCLSTREDATSIRRASSRATWRVMP